LFFDSFVFGKVWGHNVHVAGDSAWAASLGAPGQSSDDDDVTESGTEAAKSKHAHTAAQEAAAAVAFSFVFSFFFVLVVGRSQCMFS
jgi:hypothetical protein